MQDYTCNTLVYSVFELVFSLDGDFKETSNLPCHNPYLHSTAY